MRKQEESMQIAVSKYLQLQYPNVIFTSESSGVRLTMGQAVKAKKMRSHGKLPDMIILEPRVPYKGMCLELKREGEKVFKQNGEPFPGHVAEQHRTLMKLSAKGYYAEFACGLTEAKLLIDHYMSGYGIR